MEKSKFPDTALIPMLLSMSHSKKFTTHLRVS